MNQAIFDKYGLSAQKKSNGCLDVKPRSLVLSAYLSRFETTAWIEPILHDLDLALTGRFEQIDDPDWSRNAGLIFWCGLIRRDMTFLVCYNEEITKAELYPLADMKAIFENLLQIVNTA